MSRPVCVACQCEMHPEKNDVGVLSFAGDEPYQLWSADLWRCPGCSVQIISGFGHRPICESWMEKFQGFCDSYKDRLYHNYERIARTR